MSKKIEVEHTYRKKEKITCPICHGKGTTGEGVFKKKCTKCDGAGVLIL